MTPLRRCLSGLVLVYESAQPVYPDRAHDRGGDYAILADRAGRRTRITSFAANLRGAVLGDAARLAIGTTYQQRPLPTSNISAGLQAHEHHRKYVTSSTSWWSGYGNLGNKANAAIFGLLLHQ